MSNTFFLKTLRMGNGISISQLAKQISVTRSYLSRIEGGYEKPSLILLEKIAETFSLRPQDAARLYLSFGYSLSELKTISSIRTPSYKGYVGEGVRDKMDFKANGNSTKPESFPPSIEIKMKEGQPVFFSDIAVINSNPNGLVINFGQTVGGPSHIAEITTRVGMSLEHAKALVKALEQNISTAETKAKK